MQVTFYSLQPNKYPNKVEDFLFVENTDIYKYILGEVYCVKIKAIVKARVVKKPEQVNTIVKVKLKDGNIYYFNETVNGAEVGEVVIMNPDGEEYVVGDVKKFKSKYKKVKGGYISKEGKKKFVKTTQNICFKSDWDEIQFAPKGSYICVHYGIGKEYSVTNLAFDSTYVIIKAINNPKYLQKMGSKTK